MDKKKLLQTAKPLVLKKETVIQVASGILDSLRLPIRLDISNADTDKNDKTFLWVADKYGDFYDVASKCPFQKDDTIYIKEAWNQISLDEFWYSADEELKGKDFYLDGENRLSFKTPITMPKEAARFFLKVQSVHCEQTDITKDKEFHGVGKWVWVVKLVLIEEDN